MKTGNKSFENAILGKYFGTTATYKNFNPGDVTGKLNS
jgi:hypothetical protein